MVIGDREGGEKTLLLLGSGNMQDGPREKDEGHLRSGKGGEDTEGGVIEGGVTEGGDGVPEGGDGVTEGGEGVTEGGVGVVKGGDGITKGGEGVTERGEGVTKGADCEGLTLPPEGNEPAGLDVLGLVVGEV